MTQVPTPPPKETFSPEIAQLEVEDESIENVAGRPEEAFAFTT
jgi:hypothetical protein